MSNDLCTRLSCCCQNSKQRFWGTTNDATHLLVVLLSKIKTEDLASEYAVVKPLEIYTRSTHLLLKQEDTPSRSRVSLE